MIGKLDMTTRGTSHSRTVLAVDIGAESGRVVIGRFDGQRIGLEEVRRFPNGPTNQPDGTLRWNMTTLVEEVLNGLQVASEHKRDTIASVGIDAWGLDYGWVGPDGYLQTHPYSYRDRRTHGVIERMVDIVGANRLYTATGIQLMPGNSICQWFAEQDLINQLSNGHRILMMPDLFNQVLTGVTATEHTVASTTGAYHAGDRHWATDLLTELQIRTDILPEVVDPGTVLGKIRKSLVERTGLRRAIVVAPGSHDTASAVVGAPLCNAHAAFISSGTWSLVGIERRQPTITLRTRDANLANEGGIDGTIRLLRNCGGLWLLQQCRRQWLEAGTHYSYPQLEHLAAAESEFRSLVDPDSPLFAAPDDMLGTITEFCTQTGQPVPTSPGQVARCIFESLAFGYRRCLDDIMLATSLTLSDIHIVGGGARNHLLNQMTADISGLPVIAGPVEATTVGNVLVQLQALGDIHGLDEMRSVRIVGSPITEFHPRVSSAADDAYEFFTNLPTSCRAL